MCIVPSDILGKSCFFFFSPQPLLSEHHRDDSYYLCLQNAGNMYFPPDSEKLKDVCFMEIYFRFCDTLWNMCFKIGFFILTQRDMKYNILLHKNLKACYLENINS